MPLWESRGIVMSARCAGCSRAESGRARSCGLRGVVWRGAWCAGCALRAPVSAGQWFDTGAQLGCTQGGGVRWRRHEPVRRAIALGARFDVPSAVVELEVVESAEGYAVRECGVGAVVGAHVVNLGHRWWTRASVPGASAPVCGEGDALSH